MRHPQSVERRLAQVLGGITIVAVLGTLAIVPYRLYQRDIRHATVHAHRVSAVVHAAMSEALRQGRPVSELANRFQGVGEMQIRLSRLHDGEIHPVQSGRGTTTLHDTDLTYTAPPILDAEGRAWLAEMDFDLAPMKRESIGLILDLVLAVVLGSAAFATVIFLLIRRSLVAPLRRITELVEGMESSSEPVKLPEFETQEMSELSSALERACRAHGVSI